MLADYLVVSHKFDYIYLMQTEQKCLISFEYILPLYHCSQLSLIHKGKT